MQSTIHITLVVAEAMVMAVMALVMVARAGPVATPIRHFMVVTMFRKSRVMQMV